MPRASDPGWPLGAAGAPSLDLREYEPTGFNPLSYPRALPSLLAGSCCLGTPRRPGHQRADVVQRLEEAGGARPVSAPRVAQLVLQTHDSLQTRAGGEPWGPPKVLLQNSAPTFRDKEKNHPGGPNKLGNRGGSGKPKAVWMAGSSTAQPQPGQGRPAPGRTDLQGGKVDEDVAIQPARPQQSVVQDVSSVGGCQDDDMVRGAHSWRDHSRSGCAPLSGHRVGWVPLGSARDEQCVALKGDTSHDGASIRPSAPGRQPRGLSLGQELALSPRQHLGRPRF